MNEVEEQMLENQFVIMESLKNSTKDQVMINNFEIAETKTMSLLNPTQETSLPTKTENALRGERE